MNGWCSEGSGGVGGEEEEGRGGRGGERARGREDGGRKRRGGGVCGGILEWSRARATRTKQGRTFFSQRTLRGAGEVTRDRERESRQRIQKIAGYRI